MTALETELRGATRHVEYVVRTDLPLYGERLLKMGWVRAEVPGEFTRRLDRVPGVEAIHARFSEHVEEMVRQSARLDPVDWETALATWLDRAEAAGLHWWLYGSAALAIRGLDIEPGDLDLRVDDADLAGRAMADLLVEPVSRMDGWIAAAGGRAWSGALVEWLAGVHPTAADPPHEQEDAAAEHLERIEWRGASLLVPRLELQLAVAQRRGMDERAELIRGALR